MTKYKGLVAGNVCIINSLYIGQFDIKDNLLGAVHPGKSDVPILK